MKKQLLILLSLLAALSAGCSDQKATATRQRWMEIKTATENLFEEMEYANQSSPIESEDLITESLARATSNLNSCRKFNEALSSQKTVNVDPRLNAVAEKLIKSSEALMLETQRGQEAYVVAQRLMKEQETAVDPQRIQQISLEASEVLKTMNSVEQNGTIEKEKIKSHYQELEALRLELNKQYGFELPQIKWMNQQ